MARLTYNPLPALARLLEEERADADEAVSAYLKTSEDTPSSVRNRGDLLAGGGSEEPASCRSLAGPGSDSKSDAAGIDTRGRRCNLKPEMAAPDGLPREKPAMRPGDHWVAPSKRFTDDELDLAAIAATCEHPLRELVEAGVLPVRRAALLLKRVR